MFRLPPSATRFAALTRIVALGSVTALAMAACGGGGNDPPPAGVPKKIVMVTQPPATVAARATLTPAPVVQVLDGRNDPVLQAGIAVTAGISSGSGAIFGTATVNTDVNGRATFSSINIHGTVGSKTLQFTSGNLKAALSGGVTLTPGPAASIGPSSAVIQNTLVNQLVPEKPSVKVFDLDGNGAPGVAVTFAVTGGGGSGTGLNPTTDANGVATVGGWTSGPSLGANTMDATSGSLTGSPVTFTANGVTVLSSFNITLVYMNPPTSSQNAAFAAAKARWELAITGDVEDYNAGSVDLKLCGVDTTVSGVVDDLKIVVELKFYDGPGQVLGAASPCWLRSGADANVPFVGYMFFDTADLATMEANGLLSDVVLHEMGLVLGYGTLWDPDYFDLVDTTVVLGPTGVGYTGTNALTAFITTNNGNGTVVPVEQDGGEGTAHSHWDEELFRSEIMTGFITGTVRPLSATSVASLVDLGYVVNLAAADPFDFTNPVTLRAGPEPAPISLGNDVIPATIMYFEKGTGRTWAVPRR